MKLLPVMVDYGLQTRLVLGMGVVCKSLIGYYVAAFKPNSPEGGMKLTDAPHKRKWKIVVSQLHKGLRLYIGPEKSPCFVN